MNRVVALFFLVVATAPCYGMDVVSYKNAKADYLAPNPDTRTVVQAGIIGYFQAVADMLDAARDGTRLPLSYQGTTLVACVPASVKITRELSELVTEAEITQHAHIYSSNPNWEKTVLPTYTYLGLVRMFPCAP